MKSDADYQLEVTGSDPRGTGNGQMVLDMFRQQAQMKAYQSVIGLLKKEFKFEANDEQKKRLEESDKRGIED